MAKISLAAKSKAPETAMTEAPASHDNYPVVYKAPEGSANLGGVSYVTFASARSKNWPTLSLQLPGLQEGDPVLIRPAPRAPVKLGNFSFFLAKATPAWVKRDDVDYSVAAATFDPPHRDEGYHETVEALILVRLPDGELEPATCSFEGTKSRAGKLALAAADLASTPEWGRQSPAHEKSLAIRRPEYRFVTTVTVAARTARSTGRKYFAANGTVAPTGDAEAAALHRYAQANYPGLREADLAHSRRVEEFERLAGRAAA